MARDEAKLLIQKLRARTDEQTGIRWGIRLKENSQIVGSVGFNQYTENHRGVIGYDLLPKYWNQGIITEAIREILQFGFSALKLVRIEAEVMPQNIASQRPLEKCGFKNEGCLRSWSYYNGRHFDMYMYSILKSENF